MNVKDYLRLYNDITQTYIKNRQALKQLWININGTPPPEKIQNEQRKSYSNLHNDITRAINALSGDFDRNRILSWIKNNISNSKADSLNVANALYRFKKQNIIECVKKGCAKNPNVYKLIGN